MTDPIKLLEKWRQGDEFRRWSITSPTKGQEIYMVDLFLLPDIWYEDDADLILAIKKAIRKFNREKK